VKHTTYCRLCPGICGLVVEVEDNQVTSLIGDRDNLLSGGYTCVKGRNLPAFHSDPDRITAPLHRRADGSRAELPLEDAVQEVAAQLRDLIETYGPDSVAMITGTQASMSSLTLPFAFSFFKTLGSRSRFSPQSIDQIAKWVAEGRLGSWAGGRQRFADADVWMLVGTNPIVTMQGGDFTGFPVHNGSARLAQEMRRGLKLIVVDPRRTEVAERADLHLQLRPGTDATLFAGMLRVILAEGLHDQAFCDAWAPGLDDVRAAVEPFTPELVGARCDLDPAQVVAAARMFGVAAKGMAMSGTGPNMGPEANIAEHLMQALNVVCGRFPREGDRQAEGGVLGAGRPRPAEAISPTREWEHSFGGSIKGELAVATLPDRMLSDGPDRIRALIAIGANPASSFPDQVRTVEALSHLDLLVTIDPFLSDTAQLAHYVLPPKLCLERPDSTRAYEGMMDEPFAQYTPAVLEAPEGATEDWEILLRLARAMGSTLKVAGVEYGPTDPVPTTDEVLGTFVRRARVPYDDVKQHAHGAVFPQVDHVLTGPPGADPSGRFDLLPADVAEEVAALLGQSAASGRSHVLVVRRMRDTFNSVGPRLPGLPRRPTNACFLHPDDLAELGAADGDVLTVTSDNGSVVAVAAVDRTIRPGVVSMTHGFGALPGPDDDPLQHGVNMGRLTSLHRDLQPISAMPLLSALPVTIARREPAGVPG
jgi:anaerobic selenocysteine-containing dehydrogenase